MPRTNQPYPCVVIVGGTLSELRDGELQRPGAPPRTALKRLAESLADMGYGSFRYDQVGQGESRAKAGYRDLYGGDAQVLSEIYAYVRSRPECSKLIAAGESAGAYIISLAARAGAQADAYMFLGGFCGKAEEIFAYNFGRLAEYVEASSEHRAWAKESHLDRDMAFGHRWRAMFAAAHAGKDVYELQDGSYRQTVRLARRKEEIDNPPDEMFAYIKGPALALAGTRDLNVAPHHAACAVAIMQKAGNLKSRAELIESADHNFQIAPDDADLAIRERFTFASFRRPYHPELDHEIAEWLHEVAPTAGSRHADADHSHAPANPGGRASYSHALQKAEIAPRTDVSPERVHLAPGLTLIDDCGFRSKWGTDSV